MAYKIKNKKTKVRYIPYSEFKKGNFKLYKQGLEDGEWANQFYVYHFFDKDGKTEVELSIDVSTNNYPRYMVRYDGAVDYTTNNKKDLLKHYPEFKEVRF